MPTAVPASAYDAGNGRSGNNTAPGTAVRRPTESAGVELIDENESGVGLGLRNGPPNSATVGLALKVEAKALIHSPRQGGRTKPSRGEGHTKRQELHRIWQNEATADGGSRETH